jgi:cysteine desulfurase
MEREELLVALGAQGLCVSGGSSCASGALEPSPVLAAMGVPVDQAEGALRFSLGARTTDEEVERALRIVAAVVASLRVRA